MFEWMWYGVLAGMKRFFCWLLEWLSTTLLAVFVSIIGLIPEEFRAAIDVSFVQEIFRGANTYLPVSQVLLMVSLLLTWKLFWLGGRTMLRLVRG